MMDKLCTAACVTAALFVFAAPPAPAHAEDYQFSSFAATSGCASVLFPDKRKQCKDQSVKKGKVCRRFKCNWDHVQKDLETLRRKTRERDNADTESKREEAERAVAVLRARLDRSRELAIDRLPRAEECLQARRDVQTFFVQLVPDTQKAGVDALARRDELLQRVEAAERELEARKRQLESDPTDREKKKAAKAAAKELSARRQEVAVFKRKNGVKIKESVEKLVKKYQDGDKQHEPARKEAEKAVEKCRNQSQMTY